MGMVKNVNRILLPSEPPLCVDANKIHASECGAMVQVIRAFKAFENFRDVLQEALACVKNMCLSHEGCFVLVRCACDIEMIVLKVFCCCCV